MKSLTVILSILAALILSGCTTNRTVLVATGTVLGIEVAQNPSTGLYHAKLGYNRAELALVPTDTTNKYTPDVLTELKMTGLLSFDASIYQRLAVGPQAVSQIGAAALFSKDANGVVSSNALDAYRAVKMLLPPTPR